MTKILFPYIIQPIRFPFYVNDLVYIWEITNAGVSVYLVNNQIDPNKPTLKDIALEDTGISFYLVNEQANTRKHIIIDFDKIGMGLELLGLLDPFILKDIDPFSLGDISLGCANGLQIFNSPPHSTVDKYAVASDARMELDSNCVVPYDKHVYLPNVHNNIGIAGLFDTDHITIGELDPRIFGDIDLMLFVFRIFHSIPARLVKEIRIKHNNTINNGVLAPYKDFSISAEGIIEGVVNGVLKPRKYLSMSASRIIKGLSNGIVPLDVQTDEPEIPNTPENPEDPEETTE